VLVVVNKAMVKNLTILTTTTINVVVVVVVAIVVVGVVVAVVVLLLRGAPLAMLEVLRHNEYTKDGNTNLSSASNWYAHAYLIVFP
jgi:hypothetical protein